MPDAKTLRLSPTHNMAFGYREEINKLDKMVTHGFTKSVGEKLGNKVIQ